MSDDKPQRLRGGNTGEVVRDGDTVSRPSGEWTPAVHRLLHHLDTAGVPGVPKPMGITTYRREVLSFVTGVVPTYRMPGWVWSQTALESSAQLLRRVHDATAGADLQGPWRSAIHEPVEVICHNDFATYNLVFEGESVVGVIDWDFASPGPRLWDLAYLAYRIVPLSCGDRRDGFTDEERERRLRHLIAAYGWDGEPRDVISVLHERLVELAAFSDDMAIGLGKPELGEHAKLYRYDAARLVAT